MGWSFAKPYMDLLQQGLRPAIVLQSQQADKSYLAAVCGCKTVGEKDMTCDFFVATDGSDMNSGTKKKSFATPERARDAIRELKKRGASPQGVTVWLQGGIYELSRTLMLTKEDVGTAEAPIVYRALPG